MHSQISTDVPQSAPPVFFGESEGRFQEAVLTPGRTNPIRICGEAEVRLLGPTREQIAAMNRPRLRGRFVHRHKSKSLRRHPLLPIRHTVEVERRAQAEALIEMSGKMSKFFATIKPKHHTPPTEN